MYHKNLILKSYVVWSDWWLVQSPFEIVIGEWLKSRFLTSDWWVIGITIFRDRANTCINPLIFHWPVPNRSWLAPLHWLTPHHWPAPLCWLTPQTWSTGKKSWMARWTLFPSEGQHGLPMKAFERWWVLPPWTPTPNLATRSIQFCGENLCFFAGNRPSQFGCEVRCCPRLQWQC